MKRIMKEGHPTKGLELKILFKNPHHGSYSVFLGLSHVHVIELLWDFILLKRQTDRIYKGQRVSNSEIMYLLYRRKFA